MTETIAPRRDASWLLTLIPVLFLVTHEVLAVEEVEPNDEPGTAQPLKGLFEVGPDPDIGDKTSNTAATVPHVSIQGLGEGPESPDIFTFVVTQPGLGVFDIDDGDLEFEPESLGIARQLDGTIWIKNENDFYTLNDQQLPRWQFRSNYPQTLRNTLAVHPQTGDFYSFIRSNTQLIRIDPQNGAAQSVGTTGVDDLTALAFSAEGRLYASTGTDDNPSELFELDPATGTVLEAIGLSEATPIKGIDFHPDTGILYASTGRISLNLRNILAIDSQGRMFSASRESGSRGEDHVLYRVSPGDLSTERLGTIGLANLSAIAFNAADELYAITGAGRALTRLYRLDVTTGAVIEEIGSTGLAGGTSLAFEPDTDTAFLFANGPGNVNIDNSLTTRSDDTIFGVNFSNDPLLVTLDTTSPFTTTLIASLAEEWRGGLAMNADDRLFGLERQRRRRGGGSGDGARLLELDPTDGSLIRRYAPMAFDNVDSLAFDPQSGVLYAHANGSISSSGRNILASDQSGQFYSYGFRDGADRLLRYDPVTWQVTSLDAADDLDIAALAFDGSDRLYGISGGDERPSSLYEFDPVTGALQQIIGPTGEAGISGLDFHPNTGVLYAHRNPPRQDFNNTLAFRAGTGYTINRADGIALMTFDVATGLTTPLGSELNIPIYAIAFDATGRLFASYGNSGSPAFLAELDPGDGSLIATIGSIGFQQVTGLAFDPDTGVLYGHAQSPSQLITIDPVTGAGTLIGASNPSDNVSDLAFDAATGTLYGAIRRSGDLVTFDLVTGASLFVGNLNTSPGACGLAFNAAQLTLKCRENVSAIDKADGSDTFLFELSGEGTLLSLDPQTGAATTVAATRTSGNIPDMSFDPDSGVLYGWNRGDGELVTIDLDDGTVTPTGTSGFSVGRVGLAFSRANGDLVLKSFSEVYSVDKSDGETTLLAFVIDQTPKLLTIDLATGAATVVGETFRGAPADFNWGRVSDLAFDRGPGGNPLAGTLYAFHQEDTDVYTLNTSTGEATRLGESGLGENAFPGLTHDGTDLLASDSDEIYAIDPDTGAAALRFTVVNEVTEEDSLYTIDVSTAQPTLVGQTGFENISDMTFASDGTLYGWWAGNEELLSIATDTATGSTIGDNSEDFNSTGIAFDPITDTLYKKSSERLYEVDRTTAALTDLGRFSGEPARLFTLDPATAAASLIGVSHGFESGHPDIAFDADGVLLSFDVEDSESLVHFDLDNGRTTRLWRSYSTDSGIDFDPSGRLWLKYDDDDVFSVDLATGLTTFAFPMEDRDQDNLLAIDGAGTFYTYDTADGELFRINPADGSLTLLGDGGPELSAITFDGSDRLFGVTGRDSGGPSTLYELDPANGQVLATIGDTGRTGIEALDFNLASGTLFAYDEFAAELLTIDPATAAVTVIADAGIRDVEDIAIAPDGRVFGYFNSDVETVFVMDPVTGGATPFGRVGDFETRLILLDTDGTTVLAEGVGSEFTWGAGGSNRNSYNRTESDDAYLEYEFTTPGRYYLRVQADDEMVVPFGGTYLLHLSLPGGQGQVILNSDFED